MTNYLTQQRNEKSTVKSPVFSEKLEVWTNDTLVSIDDGSNDVHPDPPAVLYAGS